MRINGNTSIVDLAFNLTGSLTGIPAVLDQLPVGERLGFSAPRVSNDTTYAGQTWTPTLAGLDVDLTVPTFNDLARKKDPYTTDLVGVEEVAAEMGAFVEAMLVDAKPISECIDEELKGKAWYFLNTKSKHAIDITNQGSKTILSVSGLDHNLDEIDLLTLINEQTENYVRWYVGESITSITGSSIGFTRFAETSKISPIASAPFTLNAEGLTFNKTVLPIKVTSDNAFVDSVSSNMDYLQTYFADLLEIWKGRIWGLDDIYLGRNAHFNLEAM